MVRRGYRSDFKCDYCNKILQELLLEKEAHLSDEEIVIKLIV